jgi:hypothetical protein
MECSAAEQLSRPSRNATKQLHRVLSVDWTSVHCTATWSWPVRQSIPQKMSLFAVGKAAISSKDFRMDEMNLHLNC